MSIPNLDVETDFLLVFGSCCQPNNFVVVKSVRVKTSCQFHGLLSSKKIKLAFFVIACFSFYLLNENKVFQEKLGIKTREIKPNFLNYHQENCFFFLVDLRF